MVVGKGHQTGAESVGRATCPLLPHSLADRESQKVTNPQSPSSQPPVPVPASLFIESNQEPEREPIDENDEDAEEGREDGDEM